MTTTNKFPRPSDSIRFEEALEGPKGELDAWLECYSEDEVRAVVVEYGRRMAQREARTID